MKDCPICENANLDDAIICCNCGVKFSEITLIGTQVAERVKYNRIGGWLIIIAISIVMNMLLAPVTTWLYITGLQKAKILGEYSTLSTLPAKIGIAYSIVILVLSVCLFILMYKRKKSFVRIIIYYLIFILAYRIIQYGIARYTGVDVLQSLKNMMFSFVSSTIWILYLLQSKRVEKTFIYPTK